MAITIAVILCFCSITVGMTIMNYGYETAMKHNHGCELWITEMPLNKDSIDGDEEWTPEQYKSMQKKLEALPEVRKTYLDKIYVDSDSADGDEWGYQGKNKTVSMELYFAAVDRSDLKSCKEKVEEATGYRVYIDAEIAAHLGQGDDIDSMNQAAGNALIALIGALFASFCHACDPQYHDASGAGADEGIRRASLCRHVEGTAVLYAWNGRNFADTGQYHFRDRCWLWDFESMSGLDQ